MPNLNRVMLMGHIAGTPELTVTGRGTPVLDFMVGVSEAWEGTRHAGRRMDHIRCRIYGKRATGLAPHLTDGKQVYVEGKNRRELTPTATHTREDVFIEVGNLEFLQGRTA